MLKHLAYLALIPSLAFASVKGTGEYRYGPETSQNVACTIATEEAKKNAIANFVGELIEYQTDQVCKDEHCKEYRSLYSEVSGNVKKITNKNTIIAPEKGHSVCIVDIEAEIEKIQNQIQLGLHGRKDFKHGDRFSMSVLSNRAGEIHVFNVIENHYRRIYSSKIVANTETIIPSGERKLLAKITSGKYQSNELLVVLFSTNALTIHEHYSKMDFERLMNDIPFINRKLINHRVTITR